VSCGLPPRKGFLSPCKGIDQRTATFQFSSFEKENNMTDQTDVDNYFMKVYKENLQLKAKLAEAMNDLQGGAVIIVAYRTENERLTAEVKRLTESATGSALKNMAQEILDLRAENDQLKIKSDNLFKLRHNAIEQLTQAQAEIEQLKAEAREAHAIIDVLSGQVKQLQTENWLDIYKTWKALHDGTHPTPELAELHRRVEQYFQCGQRNEPGGRLILDLLRALRQQ
jgi:predicted RNase H-like nuclease (RuvC/YqgF family)